MVKPTSTCAPGGRELPGRAADPSRGGTRAPARRVRRGAGHRRPRRPRRPATAGRAARVRRGPRTPSGRRQPAPPGAASGCAPTVRACGLRRAAVPRPGRGQPAGPGAGRATARSTICVGYCALSAEPGRPDRAAACSGCAPRAGGAVRPGLHRAAARRALAGRGRGPPRRAGSTCRRGPGPVRRAPSRPGRAARHARRCGRLVAFEAERAAHAARPRARRCSARCAAGPGSRSPATSPAAGPRSTRSRRADCDVLAGGHPTVAERDVLALAVLPRRWVGGDAAMTARSHDAYETARRSPAPRPATSPTASACCRRPSGERSARSTRWPAGSTTSATATWPGGDRRPRRSAGARGRPGAIDRSRRPGAGRGRRRGRPASRSRSARSTSWSTACRWT